MTLPLLALCAAVCLAPGGAGPDADSLVFHGDRGELLVRAPRFDEVDIDVDGRLDEALWAEAALLTGFTQYEPVEGIQASEATEVRVLYTGDALYFGIRATDSAPEEILARLGERDQVVFADDWVRIMLDTFDDQRQAYVFYVNPLGLQTDGLWIEGFQRGGGGGGGGGGVPIDFNPDFIWESDGRVTDEGWSAEIRIPYVSLRFREVPEQDWGIQVAREVKRRGFKQSWAPLTQNVSSTLAQSGRLVGLRDLRPKRLVEVKPVLTGTRTGDRDGGAFQRGDPEADFGVDARVGVTRNLVLDATYNPDFSQVEADANQITVNERFALFFPEKRTFFLEGAEIFNTPTRLVYTRRIVDPVAGAKLTGKVGSFNVGYLGALDESPSTLGGGSGEALFNLARVRRDVGSGSTLGLLLADRSLTDGSGAYNRVVAGDARLVLGGRYTVTGQVAGSLTRAAGEDGAGAMRPLIHARVERGGRTFSWNVQLTDVHPSFQALSGFIQRAGDAELNGSGSWTRFGAPGAGLESFTARVNLNNYFTHDGLWDGARPFEHEVELWNTLNFRGSRTLTVVLRRGYFRFQPEDYAAYQVALPGGGAEAWTVPDALDGMIGFGLLPRMRLTNASNLNGRFFLREVPIYVEGSRGFEAQAGPQLQLRPTNRLQLSVDYTWSRIWRRPGDEASAPGGVFSTVNLSRVRAQYQLSKAFLVRGIGQYEIEDREGLLDPRSGRPLLVGGSVVDPRRESAFQGQLLVQYEPSPGTIFYVGFSRLMEGEGLSYRLNRMDAVQEGLFVKLSYLFRM